MTCFSIHDADGKPIGIACGKSQRRRKCYLCGTLTELLCDGTGCDRPVCSSCSTRPARNVDLCKKCDPVAFAAREARVVTPGPTPYQLWLESKGDQKLYVELLTKHGHLIPKDPMTEPRNSPTTPVKCRSCQADILWALTAAGKHTPLDSVPDMREPPKGGGWVLFLRGGPNGTLHVEKFDPAKHPADRNRYTNHFATCPNAQEHRR